MGNSTAATACTQADSLLHMTSCRGALAAGEACMQQRHKHITLAGEQDAYLQHVHHAGWPHACVGGQEDLGKLNSRSRLADGSPQSLVNVRPGGQQAEKLPSHHACMRQCSVVCQPQQNVVQPLLDNAWQFSTWSAESSMAG